MNFDDYQHAARRTCDGRDATYLALGLAGETGELVDLIKKIEHHGHDLDRSALVYEMGDVLWYLANMVSLYGFCFEFPRTDPVMGSNLNPTDTALLLVQSVGDVTKFVKDKRPIGTHSQFYSIGDALWHLANLALAYGLHLEDIAEINDAKLRERYPEGYSDERSRNR